MSTTNDPYVTFQPFGMSDRRMNRIVFVLYNRFIWLTVELIHFILYLNFVMSSWCLRDLPVSVQITAFAISRKITILVFGVDGWLLFVLGEIEKQWCACARVSDIMSWEKCCCLALRHTIPWCVCGVATRLRGVCCLRCELGVECGDIIDYCGLHPLRCIILNFILGVSFSFPLSSFAAPKIFANILSAIACSSSTWQNGPAGCGSNNACVRSATACVASSLDEGNGNLNLCGEKIDCFHYSAGSSFRNVNCIASVMF
jgi:hypothetical protein